MPVTAIPVTRIFGGLDLGQENDHSALALLVRTSLLTLDVDPVTRQRVEKRSYDLRFIERFPLRTPYPNVVSRVCEIYERLSLQFPGVDLELAYDATGVGRPVGDLLRVARWPLMRSEHGEARGMRLTPISITGGDLGRERDGKSYVPKRDLIAALVVLFQSGALRIAGAVADRDVLLNELVNFRGRMSASGHDTYSNGGGRDGAANDDLVSACAFAAYRATLRTGGPQFGTLLRF